jgi:glycosyltransferase involved in cell wall biosynthesis
MRLCYILLSPTFGMHQYTADLANRMAAIHDVHLVSSSRLPRDRYSPQVRIHTPAAFANTGLSPQIARLDWLRAVRQLLREIAPDAVHFTGPHLWNGPLMKWLRRRGVRIIHTIHDLDAHTGRPLGRLLGLWNRSIMAQADIVLVHGRQYQQRLLQQNFPADRLAYLPLLHLFLSYESEAALQMPPANEGQGSEANPPFILFFGRLELYKGVDDLLEAYRRATPNGISGRLIIAGPGRLPDRWAGGRLPPGVELRNRLISDEEAISLFRQCRALALPYIDATQSALVAAAYFFNKPVIITRSGALPEYVDDGRTGLIVPPGDPAALAAALAYAFTHPAEMAKMGRAGRAWYEEQRRQETIDLNQLYNNEE